MGKRHRNLIDRIVDPDNLQLAFVNTARAKRLTWGYLEFKEYAEANLVSLREELLDGGYQIGPYRQFWVYEPKPRLISALDFKDRLVQHALCNVISPIFEAGLLPYTFACRPGMGTHAGVKHVQARLRSTSATHFLKTDYAKFFPSVDRAVLHRMICKRIHCRRTLDIIGEIIPARGRGIPIGSLTSQLFANVYGNAVDRHIHMHLKLRHWARYMDDIVVLDSDVGRLREAFDSIQSFSQSELHLGISKWQVAPVTRGVNFLGYRIWPTHKLLRKDSVRRAKRKIAALARHNDDAGLQKFVASWLGHARWADTKNLLTFLENQYGISGH